MKKTGFTFDSRDGESRIHAVRYEPEDECLKEGRPVAILQIVHGMAEYAERYEETASFFAERGFVVTGEDHLGHGHSVAEGGAFGYFCRRDPATVVVRDVHRLKKLTQALYPGVPYFILGHSMGSFILRNYMFRYGTGIQGAIIVGTGVQPPALLTVAKAIAAVQKFFCGGKHVSRLLEGLAFGSYNKRIKNPATRYDWLSRNEENVKAYAEDPLCGFTFTTNGFQTLFELISRAQDAESLKKIPPQLPVLFVAGEEDPVGDYGEGVHRACGFLEEAGMKHLTLNLYEGARHEILNEREAETVRKDIYDWLMPLIAGGAS